MVWRWLASLPSRASQQSFCGLWSPSGEIVPTDVRYRKTEGADLRHWVRLALDFSEAETGAWFLALSLEGTVVYSEAMTTAPSPVLVLQNPSPARALPVGGLSFDAEHPASVKRSALWKNASGAQVDEPDQALLKPMLPEPFRQLQAGYPAIHASILPGELNVSEEAWMPSRTVDRQFWLNPRVPRHLSALERYVEETPADGSDFIPALSTRGWDAPWKYTNHGEHYLERLRFYLVPESDGEYTFWLATGGIAALYLHTNSLDNAPAQPLVHIKPSGQQDLTEAPVQKSQPVQLISGQAYYFEILHYEEPGLDFLTLGWTPPGASDGESIEAIPMQLISSSRSGTPGSFPRSLYPRAPEWLPATIPDRLRGNAFLPGSGHSLIVYFATLASDGVSLAPGQPINEADFASVANGWLNHPKLDWLYSDASSFPAVYQSSANRWLSYVEGGGHKQTFYDHSMQEWFSVFNISGDWLVYHPVFTTHPASQTVNALSSVTFSTALTHPENAFTGTLIKENGAAGIVIASGVDQLEWTLTALDATDTGTYRVEVSNQAGTAASQPATLTVNRLSHSLSVSGPNLLGEGEPATYTANNVKGPLTWTLGAGLQEVSRSGHAITVQGSAAAGAAQLTASDAGNAVYLPTSTNRMLTLQPGPLGRLIAFFGAQHLADNWYESPWFGSFSVGVYPTWIFHQTHGWLSIGTPPSIGADGLMVYSPQLKHFWIFKPAP